MKEAYQYHKEVAGIKVATAIKTKIYEKARKLSRFPELGQQEMNPLVVSMNYRYLVSGNYKIVYKVIHKEKIVLIASVFDTHQDPDDLKV